MKIFTNQGDALKLEERINQGLSEKNVSLSLEKNPDLRPEDFMITCAARKDQADEKGK